MGPKGVPIAIRHLKRAALEHGNSNLLYVPSAPRDERIAVIGGGPAGLMAAWELAVRGYAITVFEEQPFLGGQVDTIPKYHLAGDELDTDLARFKNLDVTFRLSAKAGRDYTPESLLQEGYLAVYVAIGASDPNAMGIPGEHLPGVFPAIQWLLAINKGPESLLGRKGRKIVVVGGGDVAMDAARSAVRMDVTGDVTVVYRKTKADMSADDEEVGGGEIEGVHFVFERAPVRILGTSQVTGLVVQAMRKGPPDSHGRPTSVPVPESEETIPCDTVIVAVGEKADVVGLPSELNLSLSAHPWPQGAKEGWMTDIEGVFASGGKSVVYAMAAGTAAANAIDAYVSKKKGRSATPRPDAFGASEPRSLPVGYGGPSWHL
jgi:NADPH-dependent glutamate synthase beta subunit-like oxidoreductase